MLGGTNLSNKQHITIKGIKDGLLFLLDDECHLDDLLSELKLKIEKTHQQLLTGPLIHVHLRLGKRELTESQTEQLTEIIRQQGNLIIKSIENDLPIKDKPHSQMKIVTSLVRSGQIVEAEEDILLIGDVHPGGVIRCGGDAYILGALHGQVFAGQAKRREAIVVASLFSPTLVVIDDVNWNSDVLEHAEGTMEYARIIDDHIHIDKISTLHHHNRFPIIMKGV
jgi:septum site-determining protein MinC